MQGRNPGIWIAAAIVFAVLVVAISIPRRAPNPLPASEVGKPGNPPDPGVNREIARSPAVPATSSAVPSATPTDAPPAVVSKIGIPIAEKAPAAAANVSTAPPRPATTPVPAGPSPEATAAAIARSAAVQAVDNVQFALRDYRGAVGVNPEGTNEEITSALMGKNLKQFRLEIPEGSRVSAKGELCDPWGTPYFFHHLSAQKMEIRSAGPDLVMWTSDDIEM